MTLLTQLEHRPAHATVEIHQTDGRRRGGVAARSARSTGPPNTQDQRSAELSLGRPAGIGQFAVIQSLASSSSEMELTAIDPRDPEAERGLAEFAGEPGGGVIITASSASNAHRQQLLSLSLRYRLPTACPLRFYLVDGGLAAYGPDIVAIYSRAADYVDRILKGARPADLPVQAPTRYELVINLKAAKALALSLPASLLARADEVIE